MTCILSARTGGQRYSSSPMNKKCVLCARISRATRSNACAVSVEDAFPVAVGHTLIIPRRHVARISELTSEEVSGLFALVQPVVSALEKQTKAAGFTIGINDGLIAGQTIPHLHLHIIPRHPGDIADPRGGLRMLFGDRGRWWEQNAPSDNT